MIGQTKRDYYFISMDLETRTSRFILNVILHPPPLHCLTSTINQPPFPPLWPPLPSSYHVEANSGYIYVTKCKGDDIWVQNYYKINFEFSYPSFRLNIFLKFIFPQFPIPLFSFFEPDLEDQFSRNWTVLWLWVLWWVRRVEYVIP